jgi:GAF domain
MAKGTVSDQTKPVLDEQTLDKLLEAAFVIQEHGADRQKSGQRPDSELAQDRKQKTVSEIPERKVSASPVSASQSRSASGANLNDKSPATRPGGKDAYTLTLAQIVETQQQILTRHLELQNAIALVAQRTAEMTKASGAAVGILEDRPGGKKLQYRAVSGLLTLARGSEVAAEKALCFTCLRSGEIVRCADVNSDLLLDAEECRRRGIGSLIAVPIYRDSGIAGGMELYFAGANAFTEQEVHSCQLMAGLVTEALGREAGVSSRKSLAAERATMLEALEKLRPNLAALMESPALKESLAKSAASESSAAKAVPAATASAPSARAAVPAVASLAVDVSVAASPKQNPAPTFLCRKCGHQLVGEEMFCGKCGSPRTSEYQPPTMQSKLASLWHMQQAKQSTAPGPANGSVRPAVQRKAQGVPTEVQPWEAVLSELSDPFGDPEPESKLEIATELKPELRTEPQAKLKEREAAGLPVLANILPVEAFIDSDLEATSPMRGEEEQADKEKDEATEKEEAAPPLAAAAALSTTADRLTWTSAAKAKQVLEQLAGSKSQNSFARFWMARRGDVYLAVAVILVAAVIRWSIWSEHSFGANAGAAKQNHRRLAPDADLSAFDKLLISLGLAEPPDPPENKGNPDTKVWVDLHSALYYCPGADLYGKTPQGKLVTQRDAQLGQFEPAYRKACD